MGVLETGLGGYVPGYTSAFDLLVVSPVSASTSQQSQMPVKTTASDTVLAVVRSAVSRWVIDEAVMLADSDVYGPGDMGGCATGGWRGSQTSSDPGTCERLAVRRPCPGDPSFTEYLEVDVFSVTTGVHIAIDTRLHAAPSTLANPERVPAPCAPSLVSYLIPETLLSDGSAATLSVRGVAMTVQPQTVDAQTLQAYADLAQDPIRTLPLLVTSADRDRKSVV